MVAEDLGGGLAVLRSFEKISNLSILWIMNNIGEGFCRNSDAEFSQYLKISKGSSGEVKSMFYIAEDQAYVDSDVVTERRDKLQRLINSLSILMKYLKTSKKQ